MTEKYNITRPRWLMPTPQRDDEPPPEGLRGLILNLMHGRNLNRAEAAQLLELLLTDDATDAQISAALVALAVKGETVEELAGMATAMRTHGAKINSKHADFIDIAGTGSSRAKTFNVSTAAAFVIAGAGLPVAKHGSRAATSRSGSADVLENLGVNVATETEVAERCLNELGICFMFAPLYHAATKRVAKIRRELGVHTTFNLLGPLANPAGAPFQIMGVWHEGLVGPVARTHAALGTKKAWIVHGLDGLDEITISAKTFVGEVENGRVRLFEFSPEELGFALVPDSELEEIRGGDAQKNAEIIQQVLSCDRRDAARSLTVLNAAAAIYVGGKAESLQESVRLANESLDSGAALAKLDGLIGMTN